jgi:hypothetical protein
VNELKGFSGVGNDNAYMTSVANGSIRACKYNNIPLPAGVFGYGASHIFIISGRTGYFQPHVGEYIGNKPGTIEPLLRAGTGIMVGFTQELLGKTQKTVGPGRAFLSFFSSSYSPNRRKEEKKEKNDVFYPGHATNIGNSGQIRGYPLPLSNTSFQGHWRQGRVCMVEIVE